MTIGAKCYTSHPIGMTTQNVSTLTSRSIPQTNYLIFSTTGEHLSIRTERDKTNAAGMASENTETLVSCEIPETNGLIISTTGQDLPRGMKGKRAHTMSMPC